MSPIFKTKSKASLDENILIGKITHVQDPIIRKMPVRDSVRGLNGNPDFHIPFWSMAYDALKFTLSVSEIEF